MYTTNSGPGRLTSGCEQPPGPSAPNPSPLPAIQHSNTELHRLSHPGLAPGQQHLQHQQQQEQQQLQRQDALLHSPHSQPPHPNQFQFPYQNQHQHQAALQQQQQQQHQHHSSQQQQQQQRQQQQPTTPRHPQTQNYPLHPHHHLQQQPQVQQQQLHEQSKYNSVYEHQQASPDSTEPGHAGGGPSPMSCGGGSNSSSGSGGVDGGGGDSSSNRSQYPDKGDEEDSSHIKGYRGKGTPYIPSYMDLTNGPEPCVVCLDAATGYHYRCMTCEGCKGFFRRTIQKDLQYHCKWNNQCVIDKTTRNQCQACRYKKCVAIGMATDLVLNDRQRVAKRRLIEDNRERRRVETKVRVTEEHENCFKSPDAMTEDDHDLVEDIVIAYEQTNVKITKTYTLPERDTVPGDKADKTDPDVWQQLAEVMTPSIVKVVEFAKRVPGFLGLNVDDQILLLKTCCMEIMCLRAACRYNSVDDTLTLQNGLMIHRSQMTQQGGLGMLVEPIFDFAVGLAKLKLDETELALLAAVLLMQSDRTGLKEAEAVEQLQDAILGAYKRYIAEQRPCQPVHWAKVLMKVTDLRTISARHAERVLCIKLDSPGELPPLFLEMFDEAPPVFLLDLLKKPKEEPDPGLDNG